MIDASCYLNVSAQLDLLTAPIVDRLLKLAVIAEAEAQVVAVIEAGLVASGVQGFWTRVFIGLVFIISVVMNTAIEDPDKVPLIKSVRSRLRH